MSSRPAPRLKTSTWKSAQIAIPFSPASRNSLTLQDASNVSAENTAKSANKLGQFKLGPLVGPFLFA